jgi:predicted nucleic acid-binding protein
MILVDSSVWINYFNGIDTWQTEFLDRSLTEVPVVMGDLILTEVLQGFRDDRGFEQARDSLSILPFKQMSGYKIAIKSAQNYRILRKSGITVRKTIDIIIGTFCILENLSLLHDDKDFEPMTKLLSLRSVPKYYNRK